jgi:hypothetical protein
MEAGMRTNDLRLVLQHDAALNLRLFELIKGSEGLISYTLIGERPQALARLQFRSVGRQVEQLDALGHHKLLTAMPASLVKHQQHALGRSCADRLGEEGKRNGEELCCHTWQQVPLALATRRLHKTVDYVSSGSSSRKTSSESSTEDT